MYELLIGVVLLIATLVVVIINRDDTLVYFLGIIGFSVLGFYLGNFSSVFVVSLSGLAFGILLRHLAHDELKIGRMWIISVAVISAVGIIVSLLFKEMIYLHTSLFLLLLCIPSLTRLSRKP